MQRLLPSLLIVALMTGLFLYLARSHQAPAPRRLAKPRLVLQITVDQLRGDLPARSAKHFGAGGFRYLMEQGLHYVNANHRHANTETIVGHTTLSTGADPASHGMVANVWLDRASGELTYNVEDARYPLLTPGGGVDAKTEIDPTQRLARTDGRSPARILTSTFGDELDLFHAGRSKVFGVSVKDRGAIAFAGHSGKAFWFSKKTAGFITSRFYYDAMPPWVTAWNGEKRPARYAGTDWALSGEKADYLFVDGDDRPFELDLAGFGRVFPHRYGPADDKYFTTQLTVSPAGDELTREFAEALIENEGLGADEVPDFLSVSFSSTDYVGHLFGPSSLESEENIRRLDRTLAKLFAFVDRKVGLENTLIVLSADHGGADAPGHLQAYGFDASYVDPNTFEKEKGFAALKARLGLGKRLVSAWFSPYLYLDRDLIREKGLNQAVVERLVADEISRLKGVALAVSSSALRSGKVADTPLLQRVRRNYHPKRSGDVFVVFEPNHYINDFDGLRVAATHGSPWSYDTYVPIMVAGAGIQPGRVTRSVHTTDIAITLSLLFGAKPPSGAVGEPLHEVFVRRRR